MPDLVQRLKAFYQAAAPNTPEHVALVATGTLLSALSQGSNAIDPKTGVFFPRPLLEMASLITSEVTKLDKRDYDRISFEVFFLMKSICDIIRNPREEIIRTHQMLPQQSAKSFDHASIRWLIRRPGNNIAQKCARTRRVLAVKRIFVPDTLENRLFKEFIRQFVPLLQCKHSFFHNYPPEEIQLLNRMKKWLRDDAGDIRPWGKLPPNNTLLGDKNYRKIWDAWRQLAFFADTLDSDVSSALAYRKQILFFCLISQLQKYGVRFAEIPAKYNLNHRGFSQGGLLDVPEGIIYGVYLSTLKKIVPIALSIGKDIMIQISSRSLKIQIPDVEHVIVDGKSYSCAEFDFDSFINNKLIPIILFGASLQKESIKQSNAVVPKHISVDLNNGKPTVAFNKNGTEYRHLFFARQYWNFGDGICSIPLTNAQACFYSSQCETIPVSDFWHNEHPPKDISRTAADLAKDIYESLSLEKCAHTLILPDMLDEMSDSAQILKRALDAADTGHLAQWLPTSIAALFALLEDKGNNPVPGLTFCFIECYENTYSITSVIAKETSFSQKLLETVPQSKGLIWERQPTIKMKIPDDKSISSFDSFKSIAPVPVMNNDQFWSWPGNKKSQKDIILYANELKKNLPKNTIKCYYVLLSDGVRILAPDYSSPLQDNTSPSNEPKMLELGIKMYRSRIAHGAEILYRLQQKCPQYPLWTDDLPNLMLTTVDSHGKLVTSSLVSDDHEPVITTRGQRTKLTTHDLPTITIKPGQKVPYVDLHRGEGMNKTSYRVRLHLPTEPQDPIRCNLNLYYTFGAANPYTLEFVPVNPSLAGFTSMEGEPESFHDDSNAFAAPEFPPLKKWNAADDKELPGLSIEINRFMDFWKQNLENFEYFASFDSDDEIINTQKELSFVGHANQPVWITSADKERAKREKPFMCRLQNFANRKCYDYFPIYKKLLGIRREKKEKNNDISIEIIGLHEESFVPFRCEYLYGRSLYIVCKLCDTGEIITLFDPIRPSREELSEQGCFDVFLDKTDLSLFPKRYEVEVVDDSHVRFLQSNKFYNSDEDVSVPSFQMEYLLSGQMQKAYAVVWENKRMDRIDIFVAPTAGVIHNAVIRSDTLQWEKFSPEKSRYYDYAGTNRNEIICCHSQTFVDGVTAFKKRTTIEKWHVLTGIQKDKFGNLSAMLVSQMPFSSDSLQKMYQHEKLAIRGMLNTLTENGRKPFTEGVPPNLRSTLLNTGKQAMELLKKTHMPYQQKQLLIEALASYGDYQPEEFGEWLLKEFSDGEIFSSVSIGDAIGDLHHPWQQELWKKILKRWKQRNGETDFISHVTRIAISRYDEVLQAIPCVIARIVLNDISWRLKQCYGNLKKDMEQGDTEMMKMHKLDCRNQLQFLLSMLRLRKSDDEKMKNILHPEADITKKLQGNLESLMELNLSDLKIRVRKGEDKRMTAVQLDLEIYGFLTGASQDEFMELATDDD